MQCLFAEPTEWFVPWLPKVLPNVLEIARRHPDRTIFTRFIPPQDPEHATGAWRDYYQRWRTMTRDRIDPHLLELVEPLRKLVPPADDPAMDYLVHRLEGPDDMPAHIKASLLGPALSLPVSDGRLALGTWQGVYLCEHRDHGGPRSLLATLWGE